MSIWIHSAENVEENRLYIENLSTIMLKDGRFTWRPLPGVEGSRMFFVRKDSSCLNPHENPYATLLERETLPQFEWPAAAPFARWIAGNSALFRGKKVLELGSGTGIVGFTAAAYAAKVVLSDCSLVSMAMLKLSIEEGCLGNCSAGLLRWGSDEAVDELKRVINVEAFDIIIGSDIFYFNATLKAGLKTAKRALHSSRASSEGVFLCASVARSERMEVELDDVPATFGFNSRVLMETDGLKLYMWTVEC
ncbi:methyltransferase-like protein 21B [Trypanosoma grayi]|uniref:methyltransferase-like protein 21B n=1 Tax=Trypanosoma grayi TaxID=71804 RepID=UPI0004F3FAD5|nr:methyltransferase-like protein 21B [Trypanosoma grayi]KEG11192.1 methyltransferase-like protein 21B [Trypanosoma grayi]